MNALTEFSRLSGSIFVDGAARSSSSTEHLDIIDPATEDRIAGLTRTLVPPNPPHGIARMHPNWL